MVSDLSDPHEKAMLLSTPLTGSIFCMLKSRLGAAAIADYIFKEQHEWLLRAQNSRLPVTENHLIHLTISMDISMKRRFPQFMSAA
jgi:hypothetical protein